MDRAIKVPGFESAVPYFYLNAPSVLLDGQLRAGNYLLPCSARPAFIANCRSFSVAAIMVRITGWDRFYLTVN